MSTLPYSRSVTPREAFAVCTSDNLADPAWDAFLERTPLGQFQQSSLWSQAKQVEGWRPVRVTFRAGDRIVGGFQILERRTRWGVKIGYVSKGPVMASEDPATLDYFLAQLKATAKARRLLALVVQPPDCSQIGAEPLERHGFLPNGLVDVIAATLRVDLAAGWDVLEKGFRRTLRQEMRQGVKAGVSVREGSGKDIAAFFDMMSDTCRRLGAVPNPKSVASLDALWQAMAPGKRIRLTIAERAGEPIAGLLSIACGRTLTFWKKGSTEQGRLCHADKVLFSEGIAWACGNGLAQCDFLSFSEDAARALLRGEPMPEEAKRTRDFLHLGFGGTPVLLPESRVLAPNVLLRGVYGLVNALRARAGSREQRGSREAAKDAKGEEQLAVGRYDCDWT
jgi:CelD/BcsL family acetyltransferase involved in cellulose biosynthesis